MNYTMSKEEVTDTFNILTNHVLKEAYDKHNKYFTEKSFTEKGKSIATLEKYAFCMQSVASFAPFFLIIFMALGVNAVYGKQMAMTGLLLSILLTFEVKKPAISGTEENPGVEFINRHHAHPLVIKLLGEKIKFWTIH